MTASQTDPSSLAASQSPAGLSLPITSSQLAALLGADLNGNPDIPLSTLGSIEEGGEEVLTFIRSSTYAKLWQGSSCKCALVTKGLDVPGHDPQTKALISVPDADLALITILEALKPKRHVQAAGIHRAAVIDPSASVDPTASIGPGCVVGPNSAIDANATLMPNCVVGSDVTIGQDTTLDAGVIVEDRCTIGNRCQIGGNSVIGNDGFGFIPPNDDHDAIKVPQIGIVQIGDDVELGALVSVDRAKFGATIIGDRVKIDNQVHVAHNCTIGTDALICGRTTLGGSVTIGNNAMIGGAVVVNDHARVGANTRIAGGAMVMDVIEDNETVAGIPAMPARQALANYNAFRDLHSFVRKVEKHLKKHADNS